ncbi:folliculin-interacting protein 2 isoform X2 [Epargyreus clarus]|uniref:folliculin-interacting protein 2 isoform X2 n=1 Tax=Epargyreus clarus TaxID=520877 RepID=UPI003C2D0E18
MKFRSCEIALEQVRLLLYKECDRRGRKVLFDSSTIEKVPASKYDKPEILQTDKIPCILEVSGGFTYLYKGPATDASVFGEMIFGAVAMNCKSVSLKIHIMNDPRRLLCTKVFCVPTSRRISRVDRKVNEANSSSRSNASKPLNVPLVRDHGFSLSLSLDRGDSGFCGEQSSCSSIGSTYDYFSMFDSWDGNFPEDIFYSPSGRKLSTSSSGSWQRRTFQSLATRFDLSQSADVIKVPTSSTVSADSQIYSNSSTSGTSDSLASCSSLPPRRSKLGLALLITVADTADMDFVRRCVEHSPQLQALVYRLRLATLSAGSGNSFVSTLYRAASDAARWLSDLMYGPRLQPTWLKLVNSDSRSANKIADGLLSDLCSVLSVADTKNTNFFISTLLTHVLTHHLGWVTTVSPYDTVEVTKRPADTDSQRPYNALWAQLGDLCGSIGFPPRAARTIIAGSTNVQFINRLLAVLTYFVRCGDVKRKEFEYQDCVVNESKIVNVNPETSTLKRTATRGDFERDSSLTVPSLNTQSSGSSVSTLMASDVSLKKSTTMANFNQKLSTSAEVAIDKPMSSQLKRNPTMMIPLNSSDSSLNSSLSEESEEKKVVFVLGDDEKLVGLKNKSNGGKSVKRSSKVHNEPVNLDLPEKSEKCDRGTCDQEKSSGSAENPTKCCSQTLQHSKPIKHSGFKFEFDKYPQIVTNYMKSKNLEILDRHYIGKPGNLKLDNFQFDPTVVPPIQEERCDICYKCQLMESMLQTPTNASEMECMNDLPRQSEPQYAKETIESETREMSPKTFVRKRKENTIIVNVKRRLEESRAGLDRHDGRLNGDRVAVKQVIEFPLPRVCARSCAVEARSGFDATLLGGVTDHYVPDLILQGTIANPTSWEAELRRDLDLTMYLNRAADSPIQTVAIVGDTNTWEVRVVGRACGPGALSPLVGALLDALPAMRRARVPPAQCLLYLESKLREFCVLSKTLADMLMSTDFCDIATLTKSLNIDVNDVPLLLSVATTHTPQVATKYGISYR